MVVRKRNWENAMALKYRIAGAQTFNKVGRVGVALFVICPVLSGLAGALTLDQMNKLYGEPAGPALFAIFFSLCYLASIPMLLIGRVQTYSVETIEKPHGAVEKPTWS